MYGVPPLLMTALRKEQTMRYKQNTMRACSDPQQRAAKGCNPQAGVRFINEVIGLSCARVRTAPLPATTAPHTQMGFSWP